MRWSTIAWWSGSALFSPAFQSASGPPSRAPLLPGIRSTSVPKPYTRRSRGARETTPGDHISPEGGPGRRYLEDRRTEFAGREDKRARAETLVERLVAELAIERPLVWHETCTSASVAVSLAVLVPTEQAL